MKFATLCLEYVNNIGIRPCKPNESRFNRRSITVLLILGLNFAPVTAFVLFSASTIREFEESFFIWITVLAVIIGYFSTILRSPLVFRIIETAEIMLENRKHSIDNHCLRFNEFAQNKIHLALLME